jgi:ketosteroid isomerase-like protein
VSSVIFPARSIAMSTAISSLIEQWKHAVNAKDVEKIVSF